MPPIIPVRFGTGTLRLLCLCLFVTFLAGKTAAGVSKKESGLIRLLDKGLRESEEIGSYS